MAASIFERIFKKLDQLGVNEFITSEGDYRKSQVSGYMDLSIDKIYQGDNYTLISLQHYFKQNGDLVPDPDMVVKVYDEGSAEAISFQDQFQYLEVYPYPNKVIPKYKKELNAFLNTWLNNLIDQGHSLKQ